MDKDKKLTKVLMTFGEAVANCATSRADLFAIKNLPFFAFGLNLDDVAAHQRMTRSEKRAR
jgi:hypothetical protein